MPVACLLLRGRANIPHGPFWLGPVGLLANIALLAWTVFTVVMYSFPTFYPPAATDMNYAAAVYAAVASIVLVDWCVRGRRSYRGHQERMQQGAVLAGAEEWRKQ